jgi:hypothetical protein
LFSSTDVIYDAFGMLGDAVAGRRLLEYRAAKGRAATL